MQRHPFPIRLRGWVALFIVLAGTVGHPPPPSPWPTENRWAGHIIFPASAHHFLIDPAVSLSQPASLRLPAEDLPPLPLDRARISGESVSFNLIWLETEFQFQGRMAGDKMSGEVQAVVPNRMLGVSLGNRIVVRGRWEAFQIQPPEARGVVKVADRPERESGVRFIEWQDRIERGKGRVGFNHIHLSDGRYVVQDAATNTPVEGFDGARYWRVRPDGLSEYVAPPESERLQLMAWLQSGAWRLPGAAVDILQEGIDPSTGSELVFLRPRGGSTGARLWLDPATGAARRAEVEDGVGLITYELGAAREAGGFMIPESWTVTHDGRQNASRLSEPLEATRDAALFERPALPPRAGFDRQASAEVEVTNGRGQKGHHFVRSTLDGFDDGWFLLDSGASDLVIDAALADRLGLEVIRELAPGVTLRRGRLLELGRLRLTEPVFIARDLKGLSGPDGRAPAGVLGFPLFAGALVEIDYTNDRIRVDDPSIYRLPAGGTWAPMRVDARPSIQAAIEQGIPGRFVVDTGKSARISFRSGFAARHRLLDGRPTELTPTETFYGDTFEYRSRIKSVEFAGFRFRDAPFHTKIPGTFNSDGSYDGLIGRGFLAPFTVVLDYANERIALIP